MYKLILLALLAGPVHAATYYKDRPVPMVGGPPCMITIDKEGTLVNGKMVMSIEIENVLTHFEHNLFSSNVERRARAVVLRLVNRTYTIGTGDSDEKLNHRVQGILGQLSDCR